MFKMNVFKNYFKKLQVLIDDDKINAVISLGIKIVVQFIDETIPISYQ